MDGATLKSPQPLETALNYARQIAEALEVAHDKGVTHRDLKPANIMVTPAGLVKVLDFGLAAMARPASGTGADSPTLTIGMTEAGVIMGTAAYMAPEQAVGLPVDRRADIWSFGVVLWEMLTGKPLFTGDTTAHILANVINPMIITLLPPGHAAAPDNLGASCPPQDGRNPSPITFGACANCSGGVIRCLSLMLARHQIHTQLAPPSPGLLSVA